MLCASVSPPGLRIKKSGGFITWNSLGQPNVNGRLAMTRSIGDFDLKNMGVIAEPETKRISVGLQKENTEFVPLSNKYLTFVLMVIMDMQKHIFSLTSKLLKSKCIGKMFPPPFFP